LNAATRSNPGDWVALIDTFRPHGTPFIDNNGNSTYDGPGGTSLGNAGNQVELRVSLPWNVQFPFVKSLFKAKDNSGNVVQGVIMLSATTIIKNE
jgi:hypothetical protein